jgi:hypothetical protein
MRTARAIERCAYCRQYVPVTYRSVGGAGDGDQSSLRARVAICESCYGDGR